MVIEKISKKQKKILKFAVSDKKYLICDGSVRSGKTLMETLSYLLWAMENFNETYFGICSKTIQSAERNILKPLQSVQGLPYKITYSRSNLMVTVACGKKRNYFYLFGGKDERSYMLIQGVTLAGLLMDEVALMPRSFVDQALSRTISYANAKVYFSCNPDHPQHWFYQNWILGCERNEDVEYLHFLLEDNPILTPEAIAKAKATYTGVFYDRYIRGLWVASDGLIYRVFAEDPSSHLIHREDVTNIRYINIGHDIGGHKSQHSFVATGFNKDFSQITVLQSWSLDATNTSVDYICNHLGRFIKDVREKYGFVDRVYVDSAEQAIIHTERTRLADLDVPILNSIKNEILERIRCENYMFSTGKIKIVEEDNAPLIDGLKNAVWDDTKFDDVRLDDGTSNIDILDGFEYSFEPYMKQILRS